MTNSSLRIAAFTLLLLIGCVSLPPAPERKVASTISQDGQVAESVFEKAFKAAPGKLNRYETISQVLAQAEEATSRQPLSDRTACLTAMTPFSRSPAGREKKVDLTHPRILKVFQINSAPVFTGFVELKHEVEVISWNAETTPPRFEFLLVKDIGVPGKQATLTHANRTFCMSCHQHGGPIFAVRPWSEFTNVNEFRQHSQAAADMAAAFGAKPSYYGVNLKDYARRSRFNEGPDDRETPQDSYQHITGLVQKYDESVRAASERLESAYLCHNLCNDDVECKRLLLKTAVVDNLTVYFSRNSSAGNGGTIGNRCPKDAREESYRDRSPDFDGDLTEREWDRFRDRLNNTRHPDWPSDLLEDRDPYTFAIEDLKESKLSPGGRRNLVDTESSVTTNGLASFAFKCLGFSEDDRDVLRRVGKSELLKRVQSSQATALLNNGGVPLRDHLMNLLLGRPVPSQNLVKFIPHPEEAVMEVDPSDPSFLVVKHCAACHGHQGDNYPLPLNDLAKMRKYRSGLDFSPFEMVESGEMPRKKLPDFERDFPALLTLLKDTSL